MKKYLTRTAITALAASTAAITALAAVTSDSGSLNLDRDPTPPARDASNPAMLGYTEVVSRVSPSVVSIEASRTVARAGMQGGNPFGEGNPFEGTPFGDFFGEEDLRRFFGPGPGPGQPGPRQKGSGSGVILTEDGYIITNNHVVAGADEIVVGLGSNGADTYEAEIVGTDPQSDLAVLKIDARGLPAATIGDSDQLKPGDAVLAIGNPFGLKQTVTSGIVSATGRSNLDIAGYENFIQTDASINPGNSGGALIDNKGRVVGINTAIFSRSGGNIGIGFAIPVNMAVSVAEALVSDGEVVRGYLGIMLGELTPELAEAFGVEARGVLVNEVMPDSPASRAGFKEGDVIVAYGGKPVANVNRLRFMVGNTRPGQTVDVTVIRDGRERDLAVSIGRLDAETVAGAPDSRPDRGDGSSSSALFDGVEVAPLTREMRQRFRLPEEATGLAVTEVDPSSEAAKAGLRQGMVITEIDRQPVETVADARRALENARPGKVLVRVTTARGSRFLALDHQG